MFKKVIYFNTGAQIVGKGITASITLLITLVLFRTLDASGYGDFTKIFVFVGYFYTFVDFAMSQMYGFFFLMYKSYIPRNLPYISK